MPGLAELETLAAKALAYADYPQRAWVPPRRDAEGRSVHDVVIVGAGLNGLAIAFGLLRERVTGIKVIDRSPEGLEGPWLTYARMRRLRTPKTLVGPDLGMWPLSFPAWYAARFGEDAWQSLGRATNAEWMDYLAWFRRTAAIPVENEVSLELIRPGEDHLLLDLRRGERRETVAARKLVLAGGMTAAGGGTVPRFVKDALPPERYMHSADAIDFCALEGKRVAVLGAGASAFDNAAVALEHGAAEVHLFARRARIEQLNIKKALEFTAFLRHFGDLDMGQRWELMATLARYSVPPPPHSIQRCTDHANFRMWTSAPWQGLAMEKDVVHITTPAGVARVDTVILAAGFSVDLAARPELRRIRDDIALWHDVYLPPDDGTPPEIRARLLAHPHLGPAFEYRPKPERHAPWLKHIHDFGLASVQSMGPVCVGLNGMKFGPTRLVQGLVKALFLEDAEAHMAAVRAYEQAQIEADPTTI